MSQTYKVGVVIVNWRGWKDTLFCLESLFGSDYPDFDVVVCDNASNDGSVEEIAKWASGRTVVPVPPKLDGRVAFGPGFDQRDAVFLDERQALDGECAGVTRLTVISADCNGGFARGNNVGIKYLRRNGKYDFFWLLNNDAFPAPTALSELVARAVAADRPGMVGSTLVYADEPECVQAYGGANYNFDTGKATHVGSRADISTIKDIEVSEIERSLAYIVGASLLVSELFIVSAGYMEEKYFLYYEEIEWYERGRRLFGLGYARDSVVYHRAGGSTRKRGMLSVFAAFYISRNRLWFTRQYYPDRQVRVLFCVVLDMLRYFVRFRFAEARGFLRGILAARSYGKPGG